MVIKTIIISVTLLLATAASAQEQTVASLTPEDVLAAAESANEGEEAYKAAQMLRTAIQNNEKSPLLARMQQQLGAMEIALGNYDVAARLLSLPAVKKLPSTALYLGRLDMARYNFAAARANFRKAAELKNDERIAAQGEAGSKEASFAQEMLEGRVENIEIIDVRTMPADSFFKAFPMAASSGKIVDVADMNLPFVWRTEYQFSGPAFVSEADDLFYVTDTSKADVNRIYEGFSLVGGGKSDPRAIFAEEVDCAYPFLLSDGCTFYFGSRSEDGIGGFDIFRSNRDNEDGTFMAPVNMGMPYNSPFNDYMLAIDEETGFGWWATDRNHLFDENGNELLTIYCFVPSAVRKNYDAAATDLKNLAALPYEGEKAIEATLNPENDHTALIEKLNSATIAESPGEEPDFRFAAPDGTVYTLYSQLPAGVDRLMTKYLDALDDEADAEADLQQLYKAKRPDAVSSAEAKLEALRKIRLKALAELEIALTR